MIAFIPNNFDINKHTTRFKPNQYNITKFDIDHALFILSQLYQTTLDDKIKAENALSNNGFVEVSSKYLQKHVKYYYLYIKYFIDTNIIESDGYYISPTFSEETKCYGYRFTKSYSNSKPISLKYSTEFTNKLEQFRKESFSKIYIEYGHLSKMFYPNCKIKIDYEKAIRFIKKKYVAQLNNYNLRDKRKDYVNGYMSYRDPTEQYNYSLSMIENIYHQNFTCIVDNNVHRMYTPLTNIYSPLRNFITHNGEKLYSIDICNSQPYLSLMLFDNNIYKKGSIIHKSNIKLHKKIHQNSPKLFRAIEPIDNEDFTRFQKLVGNTGLESRDLYAYILEVSKPYNVIYNSRAETKEGMFEVLFSKNQYSTKSKKLFQYTFPTVNNVFKVLKEEDHCILATLLQNIESYLILKTISKQLARKYPNMPIYTIHDSIVTTAPYVDILSAHMVKVLSQKVGIPPKLKIEEWCESSLESTLSRYNDVVS